jgi:hypothetical protein
MCAAAFDNISQLGGQLLPPTKSSQQKSSADARCLDRIDGDIGVGDTTTCQLLYQRIKPALRAH